MFIIVTCLVVVVIIWIPRHHGWREDICNESYQSLNIQNVNISLKANINIFFTCLSGVRWRRRIQWLLWKEKKINSAVTTISSQTKIKWPLSNTCSEVFADEVVLGFTIVIVPLEHVEPPYTRRSGRLVIHYNAHLITTRWLIPMPVPIQTHTKQPYFWHHWRKKIYNDFSRYCKVTWEVTSVPSTSSSSADPLLIV